MSADSGKTQIDSARGSAVTDDDADGGRPCPMCEEPLYKRHCKYVCPQHGVIMDCSDTFWN
ncbi:HVO_2523 family zinc finger protein [Natronoarchaeum rubrum]|uniref:HVO_2523 family zinc finger protein n=1 Tax=Natronoarchaeum rubrum TaxID=755311 RepID=UPI0035C213AF